MPPSDIGVHLPHAKFKTLEAAVLTVLCILTAMSAIGAADEVLNVDTGYYDLQRAHNDRTVVSVGKDVHFKKYVVVKVLNQYFAVDTDIPAGGRYYTTTTKGKSRTVIIY